MKPAADSANYFDEAYFQRGWERGTAYDNYRENAAESVIFKEVARAISSIFSPATALEIGCATGAIVAELNRLGVDTFGIDVSTWAVENALHPQVSNASAAALPFDTAAFELVYSSHALEHLPNDIYAAAFREMDRVCGPDAVQFHMLPIIGTHPYDYDHESARRELRKDPTHNLLQTMAWWHEQWDALGWEPVPASILFAEDTANAELSSGQFCLVRKGSRRRDAILAAIDAWNGVNYRLKYARLHALVQRAAVPSHFTASPAVFSGYLGPADSRWDDLRREFAIPIDLADAEISALVDLRGSTDVLMRIALLSDRGDVVEKWLSIAPGMTLFTIDTDQFSIVEGERRLTGIRAIYFGGTIENFEISCNLRIRGAEYEIASVFTD